LPDVEHPAGSETVGAGALVSTLMVAVAVAAVRLFLVRVGRSGASAETTMGDIVTVTVARSGMKSFGTCVVV
jgi:hypothetical protein